MRTVPALVSALTLMACASCAQAIVNVEPECNVNLNGNVRLFEGNLDITTDEGAIIRITPDYQVSVDETVLNLDAQETEYAKTYYESVNSAVPMAVDIATDAIVIANNAITEVFGQLLGFDDPIIDDTQALFDDLNDTIDTRFYDAQGAFVLQGSDIESDGWFDQQWKNDYEQRVEALVERAVGRIMVAIGTQMLLGGDDNESMIARMENFDQDIEMLVEEKADDLEYKAEALCAVLKEADEAENALQASAVELAELNIIYIERK
jgi:hypothetical protein